MSTQQTLRAPDPFDLLLDLLDAEEGIAQVQVELALNSGDCIDIDAALDHQEALSAAATFLLGGDPTPNWTAFTEATIPVYSPGVGWHLYLNARTLGYLKSLTPEWGDAEPNLDGLIHRITRDQVALAYKLLHPEEVAERFAVPTAQVSYLIATDALPFCSVAGIAWVIEVEDLESTVQPQRRGQTQ